ncbi:hypothetical protein Hanom_Chr14g01325201 [Helianthus anomalus]
MPRGVTHAAPLTDMLRFLNPVKMKEKDRDGVKRIGKRRSMCHIQLVEEESRNIK